MAHLWPFRLHEGQIPTVYGPLGLIRAKLLANEANAYGQHCVHCVQYTVQKTVTNSVISIITENENKKC